MTATHRRRVMTDDRPGGGLRPSSGRDGSPSAPSYRANLRRYWREHLLHLAVGGTAGLLLTAGEPWAGAVIMATVWVRQALEFQKRRDTPGIDLSYHLAGLIAGVGTGVVFDALGFPRL